jgi:GT2 family glycosyltransferase
VQLKSNQVWQALVDGFLRLTIARKLRTAIRVYRERGLDGVRAATAELVKTTIGSDFRYASWINRYDTLSKADIKNMRSRLRTFESNPLISVLMPVYNVRNDLLVDAIESVIAQIYPNWELCICDDASTQPHIRPTLERFQRSDPRIKIAFREINGHISQASNSALEIARGEWIALLDHDDLLRPHSLFEAVDALNRFPQTKLIYSDKDKLSKKNHRIQHYFKPDWNYELLLSHNFIAHLTMFRSDLVREVGGFRPGFEGAQDYDLTLRIVERCDESEILHIPKVLYHWRMLPGSTASSPDEKPYAMAAGERAINDHLQRTGKNGKAHLSGIGYHVVYEVPVPEPFVSILIPTKDRLDLLRKCIDSILTNTDYANFEVVIVDNNSQETATKNWLVEIGRDRRFKILTDTGDFNYSRLNNSAARASSGAFILLLNNDIEAITPGWLREMVSVCAQPGIGAVGARLWYPDGTLQHGGVIVGLGGVAGHAHRGLNIGDDGYMGRATLRQELSAVTGACLLTRREAFEAAGGLDEEYLKVSFNDIDYCLKLRSLGWRIVWTPFADLYHHESASRGSDRTSEKWQRFTREKEVMKSRWQTWIDHDPAYNPNLSLDDNMFSLAFPSRVSTADPAPHVGKVSS